MLAVLAMIGDHRAARTEDREQQQVPAEVAADDTPEDVPEEDSRPTLRLCSILRQASGSCGFHISRTQWDPYPWVSAVEAASPAEAAGLRAGDCVLEVNGEDVLGQRIGDVAGKVRAQERLNLLVWNAGCDSRTSVTLTAGSCPTPLNLQLLSGCLRQVTQLLECPVCLEVVTPPVWQCCHGHLLCSGCRARSDRCPLCRVPLGPRGRSLLADKLHAILGQTHQRFTDQRQGSGSGGGGGGGQPEQHEPRAHVLMRGLRLSASSEDVTAASSVPTTPTATLSVPLLLGRVPGRARSLSAGHLDCTPATTKLEDGVLAPGLVHCPYGSAACSATCPPSEILNHLREDHDGPLTQYFPREGRQLSLPHCGGSRAPRGVAGITMLTNKSGDSMFLHEERGRMWLWSLLPVATEPELCVSFLEDHEHRLAPVFPLSTSSSSAIASGRCILVPDQEHSTISVRVPDLDNITLRVPDLDNNITLRVPDLDNNITLRVPDLDNNITLRVPDLDNNITLRVPDLDNNINLRVPDLDNNITLRVPDLDNNINLRVPDLDNNITLRVPDLDNNITLRVPDLQTSTSIRAAS